ncbi:MAG: hypothetical protein ACC619_01970 [Paracoccaceae bacterium]
MKIGDNSPIPGAWSNRRLVWPLPIGKIKERWNFRHALAPAGVAHRFGLNIGGDSGLS